MRELVFCPHLARAVRAGIKTTTWKPLHPRLLASRDPSPPFTPGQVVPVAEPYGHVGRGKVLASSFADDRFGVEATPPAGYVPAFGTTSEISVVIESCELLPLVALTEKEAKLAGMIPAGDRKTAFAEFVHQWRATYRGDLSWESNPRCWRIQFALTA